MNIAYIIEKNKMITLEPLGKLSLSIAGLVRRDGMMLTENEYEHKRGPTCVKRSGYSIVDLKPIKRRDDSRGRRTLNGFRHMIRQQSTREGHVKFRLVVHSTLRSGRISKPTTTLCAFAVDDVKLKLRFIQIM